MVRGSLEAKLEGQAHSKLDVDWVRGQTELRALLCSDGMGRREELGRGRSDC